MTNDALLALLELHVLPPVAGLLTPWTTPFLTTSPTLPTWLGGGNSLTAGKAANGYVPRLEEPLLRLPVTVRLNRHIMQFA